MNKKEKEKKIVILRILFWNNKICDKIKFKIFFFSFLII
jgi:hypothetical protein